jgi:sugar phosphate isomerase/epimerase
MNGRLFDDFLLSVAGPEKEPLVAHAIARGYGLEIRDFGWWEALDNRGERARLTKWYRPRLPEVRRLVTMHGPFDDLAPASGDPRIVAVTRSRVTACLDVAEQLGVTRVVFHTCFHYHNPQPWSLPAWAGRHAAFWRDVLRGRTVEVLLENLWDPSPELFGSAIDMIGLPAVAACLDTGHAHVHTAAPPHFWVEALGPRLRQLHLHDNDQSFDQHLVPGEGTIDWSAFAQALRSLGVSVPAVLELDGMEQIEAAVEFLRGL